MVGLGQWGANHARIAMQLMREGILDRVIFCDSDEKRLRGFPEDVETCSDPARVERSDIDAVAVVTPAGSHFALAKKLLSAGKHVFVEKPLTLRATEAKALVEMALANGLTLMPGHIFRYHPGVREIQARINRGEFGEIRYFSTTRTAFATPRRDVGVLFSLGIHEVDLFSFLLGVDYPELVRAEIASFVDPEIDEIASMFFRYPRGVVGFGFDSWITPGQPKTRKMTIVGTEQSAEVDYSQPGVITVDRSRMLNEGHSGWRFEEGKVEIVKIEPREPLREEITDFLHAVQSEGKHQPVADAACGYRAVEIVEALKKTGSYVAHRKKS